PDIPTQNFFSVRFHPSPQLLPERIPAVPWPSYILPSSVSPAFTDGGVIGNDAVTAPLLHLFQISHIIYCPYIDLNAVLSPVLHSFSRQVLYTRVVRLESDLPAVLACIAQIPTLQSAAESIRRQFLYSYQGHMVKGRIKHPIFQTVF